MFGIVCGQSRSAVRVCCIVLCINMSAVHNIDNSLEVSTHSTDSSYSIHGDLLLVTVSGGLDSRYTDRSISSVSAVLVHYIHYIPSRHSSPRLGSDGLQSPVQCKVGQCVAQINIQTYRLRADPGMNERGWCEWWLVWVGGGMPLLEHETNLREG